MVPVFVIYRILSLCCVYYSSTVSSLAPSLPLSFPSHESPQLFFNVATSVRSATMNVLPHEIALKSNHPSGGGSGSTSSNTSNNTSTSLFHQGLSGGTGVHNGGGGVTAVGVTSAAASGAVLSNLPTSAASAKSGKSEAAKQQLQM